MEICELVWPPPSADHPHGVSVSEAEHETLQVTSRHLTVESDN